MKCSKRSVILACAFAAGAAVLALDAGTAHAKKTVRSPFGAQSGGKYVVGEIGERESDGQQVVVWWVEKAFVVQGACKFTTVGGSGGLSEDVDVVGSTGSDVLVVVHARDNIAGFCPSVGALLPPTQNGRRINLKGDKGNDALYLNIEDANAFAYGGTGNDVLRSHNRSGSQFGEDGNDDIFYVPIRTTSISMKGGNGNDCLKDPSFSAMVFDCGSGTDYVLDGEKPFNAVNCEREAHTCPF